MTIQDYINQHYAKMAYIAQSVAFKFRMDKQDHLQICMLAALRKGHNFQDAGMQQFTGWWWRLCYNEAINVYRQDKNIPPMVDARHAVTITISCNKLDNRQALAIVYRRIRQRFGSRDALVMYMTSHRYSVADIADTLRLNPASVRTIVFRCRKFLTINI